MAFKMNIKRNILLNPGPATTTDTVKMAQIVPDICPREEEFAKNMKGLREDLVRMAHGDVDKHTAVLFAGSGTIGIDICLNSLLPEGKKILVVNNGAYSSRAAEVCEYYGLPFINLKSSVFDLPDLEKVEQTLKDNPDIAVVYSTHHETGTGILNPIREIGALAHKYGAISVCDTTSSLGMVPFDIEKDNQDFCMASAQKGLMAMSGLQFVIGNRAIVEASKNYPKRSYYCNLFLQYDYFEKTGQIHFTQPVQTIYAALQAMKEYWAEGEENKFARHHRTFEAIHEGLAELGFKDVIRREIQSGLVVSVKYPDDENWDFDKVHDYCYENGFTIYPGKITTTNTFRLCSLGAIDADDIKAFFVVLRKALEANNIQIPVKYND
jgi:2-aminoethylphosphonate-pyruvate transaminase